MRYNKKKKENSSLFDDWITSLQQMYVLIKDWNSLLWISNNKNGQS